MPDAGRRVARLLASEICARCAAWLGDHLIEPAVESRQRIGDAIRRADRRRGGGGGRAFAAVWAHEQGRRRRARLREASLSHALKLPRQVVETLVNRSEVVFLVVHLVPICSASVPHAFLRPLGWITQELLNFPGPAREYERKRWRGPQARANSCLSW